MTTLFFHGVPDTSHLWRPLIDALDLPQDSWDAPDLPAFDGAWPKGFKATSGAYVKWVTAALEGAVRAGPVDLVGHDWGALMVAMAAARRPDLVRSWTIINAVPEPSYDWHKVAKIWQTPLIGELFMARASQEKFRDFLIKSGMPDAIADLESSRIDRHMKRAILRLYRSAKTPADWAGIDFAPIADRGLVLWGAEDRFVPVKYAHRFSERWSIPLHIVHGVGHWGLCQRPAAFATHLTARWADLG